MDKNVDSEKQSSLAAPMPAKRSYLASLRVWNGTFSNDNLLRIFLRPFPFLFSPVVRYLNNIYDLTVTHLINMLDLVHVPCSWDANCLAEYVCFRLSAAAISDKLPGLVPLCSSTIFTIEYNFTASQIVRFA